MTLPPSQLQQPDGEVNAISKGKETEGRRSKGRATRWPENKPKQCYRWRDSFYAKGQQCPASGAECYNWNKRGHLEMEMEMEMVFNGYSLTGFSFTIYNNIIIINTKIQCTINSIKII